MGLMNLLYDYSTYGTYGTSGSSELTEQQITEILGGVLAGLGFFLIVILAVAILVIVAKWKLFKKMGIDGWKSLISTVNTYLQMEATGVDQRWLLIILFGALICMVPIIGFLLFLVAVIYFVILMNVSLAKSFGKSTGFALGLIFLSPIFLCILAFGDSKYIGPVPMNDVIFKKKAEEVPVLEESAKPAAKSDKVCPDCGTAVQKDSKFCTKCGKQL